LPFAWGVLRVFSLDPPCKVCIPQLCCIYLIYFGSPLQVSECQLGDKCPCRINISGNGGDSDSDEGEDDQEDDDISLV